MKSKSFELSKNTPENAVQNKTYDFIKFYSPATETNAKLTEKHKSEGGAINENTPKTKSHISNRERSPNKKKKKFKNECMNVSSVEMDGNQPQASGSASNFKVTSTPNNKRKKDLNDSVKSIMKNSPVADSSLDVSTVTVPKTKSKKRNKSVSFMLDDTEVVAIKRSKSDLSIMDTKLQSSKTKFNKQKKPKKKSQDEKENNADVNNFKVENVTSDTVQKDSRNNKSKSDNVQSDDPMDTHDAEQENQKKVEKKKNKWQKKQKKVESASSSAEGSKETEGEKQIGDEKEKKFKKKKRHVKQTKESTDTESEPASKASKKEIKPDVIAQDLENLSIGDNAHTLTNLLDEMSVVDKKKKRTKPKKNKHQKATNDASPDASDTKATEEKEKVKWMKRKWNKDKKGAVNDDKLAMSVIVENLPLKIMCNYRKLLTDHFAQFGAVKQIGIAEVYSIDEPKVFTTTISFDSEDTVNKVLDEDNSEFEGNRIRIKRPLPPSLTTLVVRSYADLSEPAISSVFTSAGKIRNVRRLVKGKKSMCTAFVEFDGPEAVERAIKMSEDVKIGGKKIFAAKYEIRNKNKKLKTDTKKENDAASDNESSD